jgi:hypothetical protein
MAESLVPDSPQRRDGTAYIPQNRAEARALCVPFARGVTQSPALAGGFVDIWALDGVSQCKSPLQFMVHSRPPLQTETSPLSLVNGNYCWHRGSLLISDLSSESFRVLDFWQGTSLISQDSTKLLHWSKAKCQRRVIGEWTIAFALLRNEHVY